MRLHLLPNFLSLLRIPASLCLIALYDPNPGRGLWVTLILVVIIIFSDILDGLIARQYSIQSKSGYVLDGWGDRAFHIAIYLILFNQQLFGIWFVWLLTFREVSVYAVRAFDSTWHSTQSIWDRAFTKSYAGIIRGILLLEIIRIATQWPIPFLTYRHTIASLLLVLNAISYVRLSRRFTLSLRRIA